MGGSATRRPAVPVVDGSDDRGGAGQETIDVERSVDEERERRGRPRQTADRRQRCETFDIAVRHHRADQDEDQKATVGVGSGRGRGVGEPAENHVRRGPIGRAGHDGRGSDIRATARARARQETAVAHHRIVSARRVL